VIEHSVAEVVKVRRRGRKCRTNRGKFGSLERRYFAGVLTAEEEEGFEAICYAMGRLYKEVRA
jgi:hypothetical protein